MCKEKFGTCGTWEYSSNSLKTSDRYCSVCGCQVRILKCNKENYNYCPSCYTKMTGHENW